MFSSVPSPPTAWSDPVPTSPISPTSATRPGRLRGLSYLRTYTQNHILSRDHSSGSSSSQQRPSSTLLRATSYPSPTSSPRGVAVASPVTPNPRQPSTTAGRNTNDLLSARSSNPENISSTSGWLPASGASEVQNSTGSSSAIVSANTPTPYSTSPMARTRSATVGETTSMPEAGESDPASATANGDSSKGMAHQLPSIRFTAHQDPRAQRPSLVFSQMARILPTGKETIKVGRYSERDNQPQQAANVPSSAPVGFKSKVVSRRHCEFWYSGGRWFIKDVKSSSGTFLNHIRLSSPGTESRPFPVNDGDIVQLGIDFKGGEEMIFRCVKIRVELNKGWQNGPSSFNVQSHKRLRELNNVGKPAAGGSSQDCSICLGAIAPCQSLFVAPCSHTWHYKCIRVIINGPHWPHFICPNCRSVADLEAELDDPYADGEWEDLPAEESAAVQPPEPEAAPAAPVNSIRQQHQQQNSSEDSALSGASTRAVPEEVAPYQQDPLMEQSDIEIAGASNESEEVRHSVHQTAVDLRYLNMRDSPSPSTDSQPDQISSSTVAPLDIMSRNPVSGLVSSTSSHLSRPNPRPNRGARTPSPNGLPSSLNDHLTGTEGPMTPRNDVGPFIFDGSAGRASEVATANMAIMNLNAAADTPPPQNQLTS